ncbi:iron uptake porin [Lusitaniella coriacea]|uniref:iron uptake porin n=1 Tax=Lusitaniella coriacea TaxID=1983105 RepID=UPI003CFAC834
MSNNQGIASSTVLVALLTCFFSSPPFAKAAEEIDSSSFSTNLPPVDLDFNAETQLLVQDLAQPQEKSEAAYFLDLNESDPMAQIPSASQFRDVSPSDWAYEALNALIQRYDCLVGYPDGTFRGNRPLTRYEFAAGLNACMQQIERLLADSSVDMDRNSLESLRRLVQEFETELAELETQVDSLEERVAFLDNHQFSTTTKLFGQVVVGIQGRTDNTADFFPVDGVQDTPDPGTQLNLVTNVQLSLLTQFSPNSILLAGLQAGNGSTAPRLTNDTRLGYEAPTNSDLIISDLSYRHRIGNSFALVVGPVGVNAINVFRGANRVESAGFGPISAFAQRNPIIGIGAGQAGLGFDWQIRDRVNLQGVYSTNLANDPALGGIFGGDNGDTSIGLQLAVSPIDNLDVALHFINAYSKRGRLRTGIGDDQVTAGSPINTRAIGTTLAWQATPNVTLGGWAGYSTSLRQGADGSAETTNWMLFLNFPDLLGEGNMGGIYFGQPPRIISSDLPVGENIPNLLAGGQGDPGGQSGTTKHLELFYRYRLSDNITLTPGLMVIFDPAHTSASDTITVGALRATLTF